MSQQRKSKTELRSWLEWKSVCALELCSLETQDQMAGFGMPVLTNLFRETDPDLKVAPGLSPQRSRGNQGDREKWQVFEAYMHTGPQNSGKRWKDWLFEKAASSPTETTAVLEKLVFCCMRTAVRDFCTKEGRTKERFQKRVLVSLNAPMCAGKEDSPTIEEVIGHLTTPSVEAEYRDLNEFASNLARRWFESMRLDARVAVLATAYRISLALPEVVSAANCKKTKLYKLVKQLDEEIRSELRSRFPDDPGTLEALAQLVFQKIGDICMDKLRSEKACSALFAIMES